MKPILCSLALVAATLFTGCRTVAVIDDGPRYGYAGTHVYYEDRRPYYYHGGTRHWGYPRGYTGHRHTTHVDIDRDVEINHHRTVYNRNVKKVYVDRDRDRPHVQKPRPTQVKSQPVRRGPEDAQRRQGDDEKTTNKKDSRRL